MISHMHKQQNIIWFAGLFPPDGAAGTVRESHPDTQRSVSELDFVWEQSGTTQESAASASELRPREGSEIGSALNDIKVLTPDEPSWPVILPKTLAVFLSLLFGGLFSASKQKRGSFRQLHR